LTADDVEGQRFTRLGQLRRLLDAGELDGDLRRRSGSPD